MILSHKHKFIFLKTNKTAGTSVEIALSQVCGPDDIITPISREDERLRHSMGGRGAQNYAAPWRDYSLVEWKKRILKGKRKKRYYSHMPARHLMELVPQDVWEGYYKFCFERNPWERVISLYYWRYRKAQSLPSITEFLDSGTPLVLREKGFHVYTVDDQPVVDTICRYEHLADELRRVCDHVGVPADNMEIPRAKGSFRKDRRPYREILSPEETERIGRMFHREIELMGYTF